MKHHQFITAMAFLLIAIVLVFYFTPPLKNLVTGKIHSLSDFFSTATSTPAAKTSIAGKTTGGVSPYSGKVKIESVAVGFDGGEQRLYLKSQVPLGQSVDVTGWRVITDTDTEYIPKVSPAYKSFLSEPPADIVMKNGGLLVISSGLSPLVDNLRLNSCMGYLDAQYTFIPSLGTGCPRLTPAELSGVSGQCRSYLASVPPCTTPDPLSLPGTVGDFSCRATADKLNYDGCVSDHRNDNNFLLGEWRVWLGVPFMPYPHGAIVLKDANSLIVDRYYY